MERIAGKYDIIKELGQGGSGKVYLVRHADLQVRYALKILNRSLSEDDRFIERFKREAEVLLRFSHNGSVQLRDFGKTEDDLYYMAMDYCDGIPLKDIITSEGHFDVEKALQITIQILSVLETAHSLGIIHRDIKPDNLVVIKDAAGQDVIKLLDFGIAKLKESLELDSSNTIEGASIGTPQYMAPEQAAGEGSLDHRIDTYATGIVLYELLSGRPPFVSDTVIQTLLMHLTQPPRPFAKELGIPQYIEDIVFKAIEKKRDDRFQTAADFNSACTSALQRFREDKARGNDAISGAQTDVDESVGSQEVEAQDSRQQILCLDDDPMILNILKHILEVEGYKVFTASNCSAIHNYLFENKINLLVTDVQMPDLSGPKVCKMLKSSLKELKIVLFSNIPERELEKLSEESKADGWISKNTTPDKWVEQIKSFL